MNKKVNNILNDKRVKATAVRELVLDVFLQNPYALSLSHIENILSWSDRVTIFRTLKTFEKKGVIHQINDGSSSVKYALCVESCEETRHIDIHPHFHCEKCGKTICLEKQQKRFKKSDNTALKNPCIDDSNSQKNKFHLPENNSQAFSYYLYDI